MDTRTSAHHGTRVNNMCIPKRGARLAFLGRST